MADRSDDRLVEEYLSGGAHAFAELVRRYERRAANLAYRMLSDADEAEEVCQEAFLKAHLKLGELRRTGSFFPWFYRIVLNICRERLRVRRRATTRVLSRLEEAAAAGGAPADGAAKDAAASVLEDERRRGLEAALASLPVKYRQVIVLRCYEGMSYAEIARVMKSRRRTVRWRLYRARQILRGRLKGLE